MSQFGAICVTVLYVSSHGQRKGDGFWMWTFHAVLTLISSIAASSLAGSLATMHTFAPFRANSLAKALPMPCEPPVMTTVCSGTTRSQSFDASCVGKWQKRRREKEKGRILGSYVISHMDTALLTLPSTGNLFFLVRKPSL